MADHLSIELTVIAERRLLDKIRDTLDANHLMIFCASDDLPEGCLQDNGHNLQYGYVAKESCAFRALEAVSAAFPDAKLVVFYSLYDEERGCVEYEGGKQSFFHNAMLSRQVA